MMAKVKLPANRFIIKQSTFRSVMDTTMCLKVQH